MKDAALDEDQHPPYGHIEKFYNNIIKNGMLSQVCGQQYAQNLEEAIVQLKAKQITDMRCVFAECNSCKKITFNIQEKNPPEKRDMKNMFSRDDSLKIIKWGETAWKRYITEDKIDAIFDLEPGSELHHNIREQIEDKEQIDTLIIARQPYEYIAERADLIPRIQNDPINKKIWVRKLNKAEEHLLREYANGYL